MTGTAPDTHTFFDEESTDATAPATRDIQKVLARNIHHNCVFINNSDGVTEGIAIPGSLTGHDHSGGDNGMPMIRFLDSHGFEYMFTAPGENKIFRRVLNIYGDEAENNEWTSLMVFSTAVSATSIRPLLKAVQVSPGAKYIGCILKYSAYFLTNPGSYRIFLNPANIKIVCQETGGNWSTTEEGRPHMLLSQYGEADGYRTAWLGGIPNGQPKDDTDWHEKSQYMADVSGWTGSSDDRRIDIDLQVQPTQDFPDDMQLSVFSYSFFESFDLYDT